MNKVQIDAAKFCESVQRASAGQGSNLCAYTASCMLSSCPMGMKFIKHDSMRGTIATISAHKEESSYSYSLGWAQHHQEFTSDNLPSLLFKSEKSSISIYDYIPEDKWTYSKAVSAVVYDGDLIKIIPKRLHNEKLYKCALNSVSKLNYIPVRCVLKHREIVEQNKVLKIRDIPSWLLDENMCRAKLKNDKLENVPVKFRTMSVCKNIADAHDVLHIPKELIKESLKEIQSPKESLINIIFSRLEHKYNRATGLYEADNYLNNLKLCIPYIEEFMNEQIWGKVLVMYPELVELLPIEKYNASAFIQHIIKYNAMYKAQESVAQLQQQLQTPQPQHQ